LVGKTPFLWAGGLGNGKKACFGDLEFPTKPAREPALVPAPLLRRRLSSREGVPTPKIAPICEKTALLFWDIPDLWPVWLSGAFSKRKIIANSTYREAKVGCDGLEQGEREKNTCFRGGGFLLTSFEIDAGRYIPGGV